MNIKQLSEVIVGVDYGAEELGKEIKTSTSGSTYKSIYSRTSRLWDEIRASGNPAKVVEDLIYETIKEEGYVPREE